mmetsp:Transcript_9339/g.23626  ORF Transcript_9339/g.23626 Transcript_9339/m.23626 type:complete len:187 (+) Transcript_9339:420-980(+)
MLAVTTDSTRRVFVYDVHQRALVGGSHLVQHPLPCLALRWSPFEEGMLVYSESRSRVHLQWADASTEEDPFRGRQTLNLPKEEGSKQAVLGLDFCGTRECPSLLVATDTFIGRWLLLGLHWAPASHYRYPPRFKQATLAVLMAALTDPATGQPRHPNGHEFGLHSLPREVLFSVLSLASQPYTDWL